MFISKYFERKKMSKKSVLDKINPMLTLQKRKKQSNYFNY
jgi:hypothetical protein